ncbi:PREDICTED: protein SPT2 homolog [Chinchilla lanigera]|uniref:protein SPT2 homolog n=1 Tax=Chinchilla lanigera TaxID=34839 RepID=UPI000695D605|nr:PREDICTED: protein SPT2 homolog [Chinchilla lanigera]
MHRAGCGSPGPGRPSSGIREARSGSGLQSPGRGAGSRAQAAVSSCGERTLLQQPCKESGSSLNKPPLQRQRCLPKVSSPARRPHALTRSSPPWSAQGRRAAAPVSAQAREGGKEAGGALAGWGSGHRRAARPPRFARPGRAVGSSRAAGQMGITRPTRGGSLGPAPPIPAEEGSDRRAANPRASARVGQGEAEGHAGSRRLRLRLRLGAAHHGLAPGAQATSLGRPGRRRGVAARAIRALGARGEAEAGAGGRELAQLAAARVASRRLAGRPPSPPPRARKGALSAKSHSWAEAQGAAAGSGSRSASWLRRKLQADVTTSWAAGRTGRRPRSSSRAAGA